MAVNKVIYNGDTLVDLTSDTISPDTMAAGVTAHAADGTPIVGLLPKVEIDSALSSTSTNPVQNKVVKNSLYFYVGNTAPADPIENMVWLNPSELEQTVIDLSSCVKSVNGTQPDGNGNVSIEKVAAADKATADGKGNVIADTYSTKDDMNTLKNSLEDKITKMVVYS